MEEQVSVNYVDASTFFRVDGAAVCIFRPFIRLVALVRAVSKIIVIWRTEAPHMSCGFFESNLLIVEGGHGNRKNF